MRSDHYITAGASYIDLAFQVFALIPLSEDNRLVRKALYIISCFAGRAWDICVHPHGIIQEDPLGRAWQPFQDPGLENPMDRGT